MNIAEQHPRHYFKTEILIFMMLVMSVASVFLLSLSLEFICNEESKSKLFGSIYPVKV